MTPFPFHIPFSFSSPSISPYSLTPVYILLEVFSQACRISHIRSVDMPHWIEAVTRIPGDEFSRFESLSQSQSHSQSQSQSPSLPLTASLSVQLPVTQSTTDKDDATTMDQINNARMKRKAYGRFRMGSPADFVIVAARNFNELMSRPNAKRTVSAVIMYVFLFFYFLLLSSLLFSSPSFIYDNDFVFAFTLAVLLFNFTSASAFAPTSASVGDSKWGGS